MLKSDSRPRLLIIVVMLAIAVALSGFFLFWDLPKAWQFILPRRATTLAGLIVVAIAIGVSTVLFQTVTANRILTPSLMGYDALYILIQTVLVFLFGAYALGGNDIAGFAINTVLMVGFSLLLFGLVFGRGGTGIDLLLLIGIVVGVFFRTLASLLQRMLDPGEYQVLQDSFFAKFSFVNSSLLLVTSVLVGLCVLVVWLRRQRYDVMLLGRDLSINLGINWRGELILVLVMVSIMVSAATALVGPVTFFGLLVANLAYQLMATDRHSWTLPAAVLIGVIALVGGQMILKTVFSFDTSLSVIIEFLGGLMFLYLLLRKGAGAR